MATIKRGQNIKDGCPRKLWICEGFSEVNLEGLMKDIAGWTQDFQMGTRQGMLSLFSFINSFFKENISFSFSLLLSAFCSLLYILL